ncbi:MAG: hypothetical protein IJ799_06560 [Bacteroidales bacterium]|nr:hypothetical protein [Bacteroidales bacterium]
MATLDEIAGYVEDRPDSALAVLRAFPPSRSPEVRARHAVLHSMALDKNRIDLTTDSIIAPAVSYYARHGSADDKLKTWYYRARIAENAGDPEGAMAWLARAEGITDRCTDRAALGRYYTEKAWLYGNSQDFPRAIALLELASRERLALRDTNRYCSNLSELAQYYRFVEDYDKADSCVSIVGGMLGSLTIANKAKYYANLLEIGSKKNTGGLQDVISKYETEIGGKGRIDYLAIGHAWLALGESERALEALLRYDQQSYPPYHAALAQAYGAVGDHTREAEALHTYISLQSTRFDEDLLRDTRFIEERYAAQISRYKGRIWLLSMCLLVLLILIAAYLLLHHRIVQYKALRTSTREEIKQLMETLQYVRQYDAEGSSSDKETFIISRSIPFAADHPELVSCLKEKGLSQWEIGYCCLLLMGITNKEMRHYTGRASIYNDSSEIRSKLGIPQGISLKKYLEKTFFSYL